MARGVRKVVNTQEMTEAELQQLEETTPKIQVVGSLAKVKLSGDDIRNRQEASLQWPKIKAPKDGWIKATMEEAAEYEKQGLLVGHDIEEAMVLIKKRGEQ